MKKKKNLIQLIKENGIKKNYNKGEVLFKQKDYDKNLYYIISGEIFLRFKNRILAILGNGEIIGEKGFIEGRKKTFDGIINKDNTSIYILSQENIKSIEIKNELFTYLILYLSNRVDNLNLVLELYSHFNIFFNGKGIMNFGVNDLNKVFSKFIIIENYIILKKTDIDFIYLYGNLMFDQTIEDFINSFNKLNTIIKIGKNYIFFNCGNYIYIFNGKLKANMKYPVENTFLHSRGFFNILGEILEFQKLGTLKNIYNLSNND